MKRIGKITIVLLSVFLSFGFSRACVGLGVDVGIGAVSVATTIYGHPAIPELKYYLSRMSLIPIQPTSSK